jgi:hypothetical protein
VLILSKHHDIRILLFTSHSLGPFTQLAYSCGVNRQSSRAENGTFVRRKIEAANIGVWFQWIAVCGYACLQDSSQKESSIIGAIAGRVLGRVREKKHFDDSKDAYLIC